MTERNGPVASVCGVSPSEQIMIVSDRGMIIRMLVEQISLMSRATRGVTLITLDEGETVASVARVVERDEDNGHGLVAPVEQATPEEASAAPEEEEETPEEEEAPEEDLGEEPPEDEGRGEP